MTMTLREVGGHWYDGQQSQQVQVLLQVDHQGQLTIVQDESASLGAVRKKVLYSASSEQVTISSRLGNTSRYIYFADGQKFETRDNDGVDQLLEVLGKSKHSTLLYYLESHWRYVFLALFVTIALGFWTVVYGVPLLAEGIVQALPHSIHEKAGEQTLAFLDDQFMEESTLTEEQQQRVRQHFQEIIAQHPNIHINLVFREGGGMGANAFALPDGTILFTDEMIELAENDDELLAVMAHEIGHVVHQHGMRNMVQSSLIGFAVMLMTGDASGVNELLVGLPVLLTQLGYSRNFENEADDYALQYMRSQQMDPAHFSRIMTRLQNSFCVSTDSDEESSEEALHCGESGWQKYLSTHPSTQERIEKFKLEN